MKFRFPKPMCDRRSCYVDNRYSYNVQKAGRRKLNPGERYCIHGQKVRKFAKSDARFYTPKWCPRLYGQYVIRIYEKKPDNLLECILKKEFGEDYVSRMDARRYYLHSTTTTPYTPRQLYTKLSSGLCDYVELLGHDPGKYAVIEIDNGLTSTYLFSNKDYEWVQIRSFDKEKCSDDKNDEIEQEEKQMLYDPLLRKDYFKDKPWYHEFMFFHNIGVCQVSDKHVAEIREALARFLFATTTRKGREPGTTFVIGSGAIEISDMAAYIQGIHNPKEMSDDVKMVSTQSTAADTRVMVDTNDGQAVAKHISHYLNSHLFGGNYTEFIEVLSGHKRPAHNFLALILHWFYRLSEASYDARNQASVHMANEVRNALELYTDYNFFNHIRHAAKYDNYTVEKRITGNDAAHLLAYYLSGHNATFGVYEAFVETMLREHPTLQQGFSGLCMKWCKYVVDTAAPGTKSETVELARRIYRCARQLPCI